MAQPEALLSSSDTRERGELNGPALFLLFACVIALAGGRWAVPDAAQKQYVPGQVIVKFKDHTSPVQRATIVEDLRGQTLKRFPTIDAQLISLEGLTVREAIDLYDGHRDIEYIEPDYYVQEHEIPNDPMFDELWGLRNTGQTGGTPDADIDADNAWDVGKGERAVLVGVIDSGVDYTHPDLASNMWTNPGEIPHNGVDDDGNGFVDDYRGWDFCNYDNDPMDDRGHGTHCAGTIGAIGDNGLGVAGVNWDVSICPIKFLCSSGYGSISGAIASIEYATLIGVDIMSNSWGGTYCSEAEREAIQAAYDAGILFVASAGNSSADTDVHPQYPSAYDLGNIVSVAATDHDDDLADFSNYGATSVDLGAPGVDVLSTLPVGSYGLKSGTSMACPHVSGVAALLLSLNPGMTVDALKAQLLDAVDPLPSLAGRCVSGGRLNAFSAVSVPDSIPPAAITDLVVTIPGSSTMGLSWTATGDDGADGTASYYQVRYSTSPIAEESFYEATRAGGEPDPGPYGAHEEMEVAGLAFSTTYYFAAKVYDEFGKESPISNLATGTTLGAPDIDVSPPAIAESLPVDGTSMRTLTISNVGEGTLDFTIAEIDFISPASTPGEFLELEKGEADPRVGDPVIMSSGGPDGFGYRWVDSSDPDGPAFDWVDITSVGTEIPLTGDDMSAGPFDIGFSFPFYENEFEIFYICTNGFISFTNAVNYYWRQPLPNPLAPENLVAPFWDDLDFMHGRAYMYNDGSRMIIEYANVRRFDPWGWPGGPYTFEMILYPSGKIVFQYLSMDPPTNYASIGIQNATGDDGLQVAFNTGYVRNGLAVEITPLPPWLAVAPAFGRVYAGEFLDLEVSFDATRRVGVDHSADIVIETNDPDERSLLVPVTLDVVGVPEIEVGGALVSVMSAKTYEGAGDSTLHALRESTPVGGPGSLVVWATGFYWSPDEYATVIVEGTTVGIVGPADWDCASVVAEFNLGQAQLQQWLADGVVNVTVRNSPEVTTHCGVKRHTVILRYRGPGEGLDFEPLFVGLTDTLSLLIQNTGTDVLNVSSISTDDPQFSLSHSSLTLDPRWSETVEVVFAPSSPGAFSATLSIESNDSDEPLISIPLTGEGLDPPIIEIIPDSLSEELLTGEISEQAVTICNLGANDLTYKLSVPGSVDEQYATVGFPDVPRDAWGASGSWGSPDSPAPGDSVTSDQAPPGYQPLARIPIFDTSSQGPFTDVLIVQDRAPWGSVANEVLLEENWLSFHYISSSELAATDIDPYRIVLFPSVQPTSFYENITAQRAKLEAYLNQGGVLEVHACSWGWGSGDASDLVLPGGMRVDMYFSDWNTVILPDHPLVSGLPSPFYDGHVSQCHFLNEPAGRVVVTRDRYNKASLLTYRFGNGLVLASTQTLEHGFDRQRSTGQILRNMVAYAKSVSERKWLSVAPTAGTVRPGDSQLVTATFDATDLDTGTYWTRLIAFNNDPASPAVTVPASLNVQGWPDLRVSGNVVSLISTLTFDGSGTTRHILRSEEPPDGPGTMTVEITGDYGGSQEYVRVTVEDEDFGTVGPMGWDCGTTSRDCELSLEQLQEFFADGLVDVYIENTGAVQPFCGDNRHTVVLEYPTPAGTVDFGSLFVGTSDTLELLVQNRGTEILHVTSLSTSAPQFWVSHASFAVNPRASQPIKAAFTPLVAGSYSSELAIESNDPYEPLVSIPLTGEATERPIIRVTPDSIVKVLPKGWVAEELLTVSNEGSVDLAFEVSTWGLPADDPAGLDLQDVEQADDPAPGGACEDTVSSEEPPAGYVPAPRRPTFEALVEAEPADVLIVQDLPPWGSNANQILLADCGLSYDMIGSGQLWSTDLESYRIVILASDQPTVYYTRVTNQRTKLEAYLDQGGILEVHACGWGWNGGDASDLVLPAGIWVSWRETLCNTAAVPDHPLVSGLPPEFCDNPSVGRFRDLPPEAEVITVNTREEPTSFTLRFGDGLMIGSTHVLEYGFDRGRSAGRILRNLIAYSYGMSGAKWLSVSPTSGAVPPGDSLHVTATIDAGGLEAGAYRAEVVATSNDPLAARLAVAVDFTIILAPDIVVAPTLLDFGPVFLGYSGTLVLTVANEGSDVLSVADVVSSDGHFVPDMTAFDLDPGASIDVPVTMTPTSLDVLSATLAIFSNDPYRPEVEVELTGWGLVPPEVGVAPDSVHAVVHPDVCSTKRLVIYNTGGSDLSFKVGGNAAYMSAPSAPGDRAPQAQDVPEALMHPQALSDREAQAQGGPDEFGHSWIDSDQPGGPDFEWVDITAVGARIPMVGAYENTGPYPIGFDFPFYGRLFDSFRISTNGFISFTDTGYWHYNRGLPSGSYGPENVIAVWWDDLNFGQVERAYYYNDGTRFIVEYVDVTSRYGGGGPYTFEIILYPNGKIVMQYLTMGYVRNSATIGIQNATKDDGLQICYNSTYVHDNLAIQISAPSWLGAFPREGVVGVGDSLSLEVMFDAFGLPEGEYNAGIDIISNDPATPTLFVPVHMAVRVIEAAWLDVGPNTLNLGSQGKWITAYLELPQGYDPAEVVISTVLFEYTVQADPHHHSIADHDGNGISDLMLKFSRGEVEAVLPEGDRVPVTVVGEVMDTAWFAGTDTIRAIRPHLAAVGSPLYAGSQATVTWTPPDGCKVDHYSLHLSSNGGDVWDLVEDDMEGTSYRWTVPVVSSKECLLRLYAHDNRGIMGSDTSDEPFEIVAGYRRPEPVPPRDFVLFQNQPNPAHGVTAISFDLPGETMVSLKIFDAAGKLVRVLAERAMPAGRHSVVWDGKNDRGHRVSAGVYFYSFEAGEYEATRKLVLVH